MSSCKLVSCREFRTTNSPARKTFSENAIEWAANVIPTEHVTAHKFNGHRCSVAACWHFSALFRHQCLNMLTTLGSASHREHNHYNRTCTLRYISQQTKPFALLSHISSHHVCWHKKRGGIGCCSYPIKQIRSDHKNMQRS